MANPIFKIKKNITDESILSGLTAGELFVNLVTNALYAQGQTFTIPMCAQVDTDPTLSSNSGFKIPTQKAVKTYIDNIPQISVNELEERNTPGTQSLGSSTTFVSNTIVFQNIILDTIPGLTYSNGIFTNISGQSAIYNISYNIALRTITGSNSGRYAFLFKSNGEKYGSCTKTPSKNSGAGLTGMILDGNSNIQLDNNQSFSLRLIQDSGISILSGGSAGIPNIFQNKISIYRLS